MFVDHCQSPVIVVRYHRKYWFFPGNLFNRELETTMYKTAYEPRLVDDGVTFTVEVGFTDRDCLVSRNALAHLRRMKGGQLDPMETYRAFEDQIHGVARRLVVAGVSGDPLVLGAAYFV
jgi:hypothetical protein